MIYLSENTFLIANHNDNEKINPLAFVDEKGEVLFDVDISVFEKEISAFEDQYIGYYKNTPTDLKNFGKGYFSVKIFNRNQ